MSVPIKVSFNNNFRRVSVPSNTSLNELWRVLAKLLAPAPVSGQSHSIVYLDDADELVHVFSDEELSEAFRLSLRSNQPFKFELRPRDAQHRAAPFQPFVPGGFPGPVPPHCFGPHPAGPHHIPHCPLPFFMAPGCGGPAGPLFAGPQGFPGPVPPQAHGHPLSNAIPPFFTSLGCEFASHPSAAGAQHPEAERIAEAKLRQAQFAQAIAQGQEFLRRLFTQGSALSGASQSASAAQPTAAGPKPAGPEDRDEFNLFNILSEKLFKKDQQRSDDDDSDEEDESPVNKIHIGLDDDGHIRISFGEADEESDDSDDEEDSEPKASPAPAVAPATKVESKQAATQEEVEHVNAADFESKPATAPSQPSAVESTHSDVPSESPAPAPAEQPAVAPAQAPEALKAASEAPGSGIARVAEAIKVLEGMGFSNPKDNIDALIRTRLDVTAAVQLLLAKIHLDK